MCLIDKLAVIWATFLVLLILAFQEPGGFERSIYYWQEGWWPLMWKFVLVPWGALRFLDLILGGPRRRSYRLPAWR